MSLAAGTRLGPYEVRSRIGAGGMGQVYLAHDDRLDRDVALKVLEADVLDDPAAGARLRREARALSRLNHPNIASVYDFDTDGGTSYLVMEYVSGPGLADLIDGGPVGAEQLLDVALQLADGLVAAHREGVVHRDLKPGNLRLTPDGRLKILDFGVATVIAPVTADDATRTAFGAPGVVGTMPYMAPEQLRGASVDVRTDIYAAGTVLYELAVGRRPFSDTVPGALVDAILHAAPLQPARFRPDLAPPLEAVILKCLEKDPGCRYQSAADLLADLKRCASRSSAAPIAVTAPTPPPPASLARDLPAQSRPRGGRAGTLFRLRDLFFPGRSKGIQSLAVLPLDNFSHDASQQYFVDGMTETLTTHLAHITSIRVVGRTSAMQFGRDRRPPIPEIADVLGVDAVVEGSVLREGQRVRITAQLVAASPERHLWSNSYDRDVRDVLQIHSEVSQAIAREIRATLTPEEQSRLSRARPVNPEAYQAYLRGRQAIGSLGPHNLAAAEQAFNEAIALDPTFAPAHCGVASLRLWVGLAAGAAPPRTIASQARVAVVKALELDPSFPDALAIQGVLNLYLDWDWASASRRLKRALELNPSDGTLYHPYGDYLLVQGDPEQSVEYCRKGAALDPLSAATACAVGKHLSFVRKWDEMIAVLDRCIVLAPDERLVRVMKGTALWESGDMAGAIGEWSVGLPGPLAAVMQRTYTQAGPHAAVHAVGRGMADASRTSYVSPYTIASWFAMAADVEATLDWLERSYEDRTPFLLHMKFEPAFDLVRRHDRFQAVVARIGFPDRREEAS